MQIDRKGTQPWALVKDEDGHIRGLWVADLETAKNEMRLRTIVAGEMVSGEKMTSAHYEAVASGAYRLETNDPSKGGGYLLMFGQLSSQKQGEDRGVSPRSVAQSIRTSCAEEPRGETIRYEIYSLSGDGGRALLAEGTRIYTLKNILDQSRRGYWSKGLYITPDFAISISSSNLREDEPPLVLSMRMWKLPRWRCLLLVQRAGWSCELFTRQDNGVYKKEEAPGPGCVRVEFRQANGVEEPAFVEFLDDITLRLSFHPRRCFWRAWDTHEMVIGKGSVFRVAP